jgi:hypothetical protein
MCANAYYLYSNENVKNLLKVIGPAVFELLPVICEFRLDDVLLFQV